MDVSDYPTDTPHVSAKSILLAFVAICGVFSLMSGMYFLMVPQEKDSPHANESLPDFAPKKTISVDVQGEVAKPGIQVHSVPFDSKLRIADLLASAGGVLETSDKEYIAKNINLASEVKDGFKIYIPKDGENEAVLGASQGSSAAGTSVNTATIQQLEALPGIGATRAQRIIEHRPYTNLEDLGEKAEIPASVLEKIQEHISF